MALILTDEQKVQLSINPVTAAGNAARVDGVPVWSVSDSNVLSLEVAEDGLSAWVSTVGPLGESQVAVVADADLGEGRRELAATLDVTVVAAEAASLAISAGAPVLK
jgi:hypothetical protein